MLWIQIPQCPELRPITSIGISHFSFYCNSICGWLPLRDFIYHEFHCSVPLQCSITHLSQRAMDDPSRPPYCVLQFYHNLFSFMTILAIIAAVIIFLILLVVAFTCIIVCLLNTYGGEERQKDKKRQYRHRQ